MDLTHLFRNPQTNSDLLQAIKENIQTENTYHFMEFCGGHTHTIFKFGLDTLLPEQIRLIHGPGCPVCVLPIGRLDMAIALTKNSNIILCTYGDMLRVPGSAKTSLLLEKAQGAQIRMVYSCLECLEIAKENPDKEVVFFAIGFETTTPPTAVAIKQAIEFGIKNFSVFSNHVLTPSALQAILDAQDLQPKNSLVLAGFIGPGHVGAITGSRPFEFFSHKYRTPIAIAGFEATDLLQAILCLIKQINAKTHEVNNVYPHVVTRDGNRKAKQLVAEFFEQRPTFEWRGLGQIPRSGLRVSSRYADYDAEIKFAMPELHSPDHAGCACGDILRGLRLPQECPLFGKLCSPEYPVGACMVSPEGACATYFKYKEHKKPDSRVHQQSK